MSSFECVAISHELVDLQGVAAVSPPVAESVPLSQESLAVTRAVSESVRVSQFATSETRSVAGDSSQPLVVSEELALGVWDIRVSPWAVSDSSNLAVLQAVEASTIFRFPKQHESGQTLKRPQKELHFVHK